MTKVESISFNQDNTLFAVAHSSGFSVHNTNPTSLLSTHEFGSVLFCRPVFRSNIMLIVCGGLNPRYSKNKVIVWDEEKQQVVGQVESTREVKTVNFRQDRLFLGTDGQVFVFEFGLSVKELYAFDSHSNERRLLEVAQEKSQVLAFPARRKGFVCAVELPEQIGSKPPNNFIFQAHSNDLICLALMRVFNRSTTQMLSEFRRGADPANLYCLAFNASASLLAASSDKGTIHIFNLNDTVDKKKTGMKEFLANLAGEKSVTQARITPDRRNILGWISGNDEILVAITFDGAMYQFTLDSNGDCKRKEYAKFL